MAKAVGIDLGTTNSCVAVFQHGRIEVIANENGSRTTPSFVAFADTDRFIGESAKSQAAKNPANTVYAVKRLIGRNFEDASVQADMKQWPFSVVKIDDLLLVEVEYNGQTKRFHPEEISAMVLTKMKETAESYLGHKIKQAVITVPAYFNDAQRQATKTAGAIAQLEVLRIINEPTAAAIAYGLDTKGSAVGARNILVYDLGGGTLDVSILTITGGDIKVLATAGDTHLGGEDFDNLLVQHFVQEFATKYKKDISIDQRAIQRLRNASERAKCILSSSTQASIDIYSLHQGIDFSTSITRARFEDLNADLFRRTMLPVQQALTDAGLDKSKIDDIVLVGGCTRMPKIRALLEVFFVGKELMKSINPDEAVAYGAAVQAAILSGDTSDKIHDIILQDVTPLSLGVRTIGDVMNTVIPRNTRIPCNRTKEYMTSVDYQTRMLIAVFEGEFPNTKDNNYLGEFCLEGIPPKLIREAKVDVTFALDANGILNVTAVARETGSNATITITKPQRSKETVEKMLQEAEIFRAADELRLKRIAAKNSLQQYCFQMKTAMTDNGGGDESSDAERKRVTDKCEETLQWMDVHSGASEKEIQDKRVELESACVPRKRKNNDDPTGVSEKKSKNE